ncbi:MAG: tRNA (adenosine(37)-N6)-threonylcarbamoyltransferase complex dimerization subunit type 1 TsaB [Paracoccus sp. (in: a-proteobacteria)]|nr:tRNA (adenosine(37)-N6)-threonylcarbamoyltransferase complex dimerization subunit type 1 TsaB [Paracoccus sp. (in: a-proteobacteria)]
MPDTLTLGPEALTLGFDTSAAHCAAALLRGDRLIGAALEPMEKGQAERLMPLIEGMLADAGVAWRDLSLIGVGTGPGNFTGIRISVAAARGLALSLGVPAVGVGVLDALAHGQSGAVVASADARRDRLYVQVFDGTGTGTGGGPVLCDLDSLPPLPARAGPLCIGHHAKHIAARCGGQVAPPRYPLAEAIARIARTRRDAPGPRPAPIYLRPADAAPARERGPVMLS